MVVLLVIVMFALFIVIDLVRERRTNKALLIEGESVHAALEEHQPRWVGGFQFRSSLRYHMGHTWVHWITPDQAFIGIDDFARRLLGRGTRFSLPPRGAEVRQGAAELIAEHDGRRVRMSIPVGGELIGTNPRLREQPELAFDDPYGAGWIFKVRSKRLVDDVLNLLSGSLAERWMEDAAERLRHQLMLASGSVVQDGAIPIDDLGSDLTDAQWCQLVGTFLASGSPARQ